MAVIARPDGQTPLSDQPRYFDSVRDASTNRGRSATRRDDHRVAPTLSLPGEDPSPTTRVPGPLTAQRVDLSADYWAVELQAPSEIEAHLSDWRDLSSNAATTNVFYEPWLLRSAWEQRLDNERTSAPRVVLVYRRGQATQFPPVLIGVFPCVVGPGPYGRRVPMLQLWKHRYCFDATPLVRRGSVAAAVDSFFEWARQSQGNSGVVHLADFSASSPFAGGLAEWISANGAASFAFADENRAALIRHQTADQYIARSISASTRRELRRQRRRLEELGEVSISVATTGAEIGEWAEQFIELESRGWKHGTALKGATSDKTFFRVALLEAADRGLIEGQTLALDGRPIAMKCNLYPTATSTGTQRVGVAFKITYDEAFKKYSPGVLLEVENIHRFHNEARVEVLDSCARMGHSMIDRLWSDRIRRASVVVSLGSLRSRCLVSGLHIARVARRLRLREGKSIADRNF